MPSVFGVKEDLISVGRRFEARKWKKMETTQKRQGTDLLGKLNVSEVDEIYR